jgi:muramidase (phage lysozyme)
MNKINFDEIIKNKNVRQFLAFISHSEGTGGRDGYYILVGGRKIYDLSKHPNKVGLVTKSGKSTAFGRYQTTFTTYADVAPKLGIKDMSPNSQDKIAAYLINRSGALENVLKGDFVGAIKKLGGVWASLPSSLYKGEQPSHSWDIVKKFFASKYTEPNTFFTPYNPYTKYADIIDRNMRTFIPEDENNPSGNPILALDDTTQGDLTRRTLYDVNKTPEELALVDKMPEELALENKTPEELALENKMPGAFALKTPGAFAFENKTPGAFALGNNNTGVDIG